MLSDYLIYTFIAIGLTFNGLGCIGLLRFPDVYTRLHAATKATTFGSIFTSLAVIVYAILSSDITLTLHTIVAIICLLLTNPVSAHAIARAAHRSGVLPERAVVDKLAEVKK